MAGFDKIQITRDTKANIVSNLSKLNEFELVIATDEKKLYAKIQGRLEDLSGLVQSDIVNDLNGGSMPVSADVAKQLNDAINVVKATANKASTDATQALTKATEAKQGLDTKVNKTGGDTLSGLYRFGLEVMLNSLPAYGKPALILDKAGYNHFGIGADERNAYQIRYGQVVDNTWDWGSKGDSFSESFKHIFDGKIFSHSGTAEVFDTNNCIIKRGRNGYFYSKATGLKVQWGYYNPSKKITSTEHHYITFPLAFQNYDTYSFVTSAGYFGENYMCELQTRNLEATRGDILIMTTKDKPVYTFTPTDVRYGFYWLAIGY